MILWHRSSHRLSVSGYESAFVYLCVCLRLCVFQYLIVRDMLVVDAATQSIRCLCVCSRSYFRTFASIHSMYTLMCAQACAQKTQAFEFGHIFLRLTAPAHSCHRGNLVCTLCKPTMTICMLVMRQIKVFSYVCLYLQLCLFVHVSKYQGFFTFLIVVQICGISYSILCANMRLLFLFRPIVATLRSMPIRNQPKAIFSIGSSSAAFAIVIAFQHSLSV